MNKSWIAFSLSNWSLHHFLSQYLQTYYTYLKCLDIFILVSSSNIRDWKVSLSERLLLENDDMLTNVHIGEASDKILGGVSGLLVVQRHHREEASDQIWAGVGLSEVGLVLVHIQIGQDLQQVELDIALGDLSGVDMLQGPGYHLRHRDSEALVNADLGNSERICCHF